MDTVIGYKIRKVREIKNLSQSYMADKLSISQSSYSDIENCKTKISEEKLNEIARVLEVDSETIKNFNDQVVFNACSQSGYYNTNNITSTAKIEELYKELIKSKDEQILQLQEQLLSLKNELRLLRES
ncbi:MULTISPECIES: helix-turn-helix domain-containing protein [Flavobacteriales]|uniref:Helix-turn-helix domain protein n=1 Tax=Weeksella virosa (strain ATCC 43766 / DSM 16922 / JCM 21250 / CCUG 30538 / CDC 9751 / IAM 14551 / NBRC 16016 / NCTC 11634 / CL345/78) TaxID=865938 RepID=F0NYV2_WEEVC|nr:MULTISPECIES: helix-turn-helix transcriptional regulator [Flavobacteriales]ADX67154.1 helix-turn-helix domain protein [Weeksella virosa DSM 16922]MDK7676217.1 helix-turn-helix transcriptional regulator [Weeksella virosa]SUP53425.1 Predicted transcriptional regulator [Weeksella virosa]VEH63109.1 Predicted transcriptional regulator [Weeksella virosa]